MIESLLTECKCHPPALVAAVHDLAADVARHGSLHRLEAVRAVGGQVLRQDGRDARTLDADDVGDGNVARCDGEATSVRLVPE